MIFEITKKEKKRKKEKEKEEKEKEEKERRRRGYDLGFCILHIQQFSHVLAVWASNPSMPYMYQRYS